MAVEEAKQIIKDRPSFAYMSYTDRIQFSEALDVAVRSLEAWDKVREIFKAKSTSEDWEYIHDLQIWEDALEIIDKHLSEVSE